jgi:hypothetical protein
LEIENLQISLLVNYPHYKVYLSEQKFRYRPEVSIAAVLDRSMERKKLNHRYFFARIFLPNAEFCTARI